jgi:hypothetical protein
MTATIPEHTVTKVPCAQCHTEYKIELDDLRELVDSGEPPHCGCKTAPGKPQPKPNKGVSKAKLIIATIRSLEQAYGGAPHVSAIVVAAWHATPSAFGLAWHEDAHPDSNRVIMELVKMKKHGLLHQPGRKLYGLTDAGRAVLRGPA